MNNETVQMAYIARLAWSTTWAWRERPRRPAGLGQRVRALVTAVASLHA